MQKERGRNNARSLFGVHEIPSTQQIGNLLDPISPEHLDPAFVDIIDALHRHRALDTHRQSDGRLSIALDGTEYHGSRAVHCAQRSARTFGNGQTQFYPVAVTPAIVAPGQADVFPLPPAFVRPQDGHAKQDCELTAATRWLQQRGGQIAPWRTILLGDDLYCHQPFCQQALAQDGAFLFVCRPPSHPLLYEWVADFERRGEVPTVVKTRWTGTRRLTETYRWLNDLPLRDGNDALPVGWRELTAADAAGNVLYRNAWASSEPINADTMTVMASSIWLPR